MEKGNISDLKLKLNSFHDCENKSLSNLSEISKKPIRRLVHVYSPLSGKMSLKLLSSTNEEKSWIVLMGGQIPPFLSDIDSNALKSPPNIKFISLCC